MKKPALTPDLLFKMKSRTNPRPKPETKPDKARLVDGTPVSTLRRIEQLGKEITTLQTELQKLADQQRKK